MPLKKNTYDTYVFFFRNPLSWNYQLDLGDDGGAARNQPSHSVFLGVNHQTVGLVDQADFGEDSAENFKRLGWWLVMAVGVIKENDVNGKPKSTITHPGSFHLGNPVGDRGVCTWCCSNSKDRPEAFDTSKWVPQNEWFTMENPIKMAVFGRGTPILGRP